ncbi:MAG TPA: DUF5518 domain-containing protein [Candidatus Dormibacteraeota bacterium]|nr:DUF5518 domain-containing protein [Candidatus Dormibacteraeota bacterium]
MDRTPSSPVEDKTADLLLGIGVGFLVNLILGSALPQMGPFIAGLVAGVIVKTGPLRGAEAGFVAGTLGELASTAVWILTNLVVFPGALFPYAYQTIFAVITSVSAVMGLSGGIVGSVLSLQHWPRMEKWLTGQKVLFRFLRRTGPVELRAED